ncbi:MAG: S41 family peptidase, partial [Deltaproteobacteria bacterium]|nr:S41 family peptidase [Deltaproteobacteria bacterium]
MLESLDPHSSFLSPTAYKELRIDTKGEFGGIGIVITMEDGLLTVVSPIEGTPAYKAGIKAGDHIIMVDDKHTKKMKLWEAVKKMRGKKGTTVVITVMRKGFSKPKEFKLERDVIPLQSVRSYTLEPGYVYLRISSFREGTFEDVLAALEEHESAEIPVKGLILDLRDNPGGLLPQAIKVADVFLDEGEIVSIKGRSQTHSKVYSAHSDGKNRAYPIVLLINEGSASASEMALLLGTTSFGKGSVQAVEPLRDGAGLKLTIARYYTPSGHSIQAKGIEPDVVVKNRLVPESDEPYSHRVKEKDLENHISAKPDGDSLKDHKDNVKYLRGVRVPGEKPSEIVKALTTKDNQIIRALQILRSWQIFSKMGHQG